MNIAIICHILGLALEVEGAFMTPALIIGLARGEWAGVSGLAASMALVLLSGVLLRRVPVRRTEFYAREGFVTVGLTWVVLSAFGGLPFYISGDLPTFVDCFFETVSGFTTTGASIIPAVEELPMCLLYWRSFTNWLGGMGVLVFVLAISSFTENSGDTLHILRAESPGVKVGKLVPRMRKSSTILYAIYFGLTAAQVILLAFDMPFFDALCTAFATGGTGGFSVRNAGIAAYSPYAQRVITVFMLLFSVNFSVYYLLLLRRFRAALRNEELWCFLAIYTVSTLVIAADITKLMGSFGQALHHSAFTVSSIISTTGFAISDFDAWPWLSKTMLVFIMFIGACAGSTGGGIKVVRAVMAFKVIRRGINRTIHPQEVRLIHMDGEAVDDETAESVSAFLLLYVLLFVGAVLLLALDGLDFTTTFSAVAACLNNIGPALGKAGPMMNYNCFSQPGKVLLAFAMLFGRLEVYPMLLLFVPNAWKK